MSPKPLLSSVETIVALEEALNIDDAFIVCAAGITRWSSTLR